MEGASVCRFTNICVFCGSSPGKGVEFLRAANTLGRVLAARKIHVVYGGGSFGLMGAVSTAAYLRGSQVLGIILSILFQDDKQRAAGLREAFSLASL